MSFGLPVAIGAAIAEPQRKVICFSGDGSLMMNLQVMATLVENGLDVKVILMTNRALGLVHQQQSLFFKKNIYGATYLTHTDFWAIAAGFGMDICDLNAADNKQEVLAAAIQRPAPCLIRVHIDSEEKVLPMVPPGAANTEMLGE